MKKGTIEAYFSNKGANIAYASEIQKFFGSSVKVEAESYGHFKISSEETEKSLFLMFGHPGKLKERYIKVFLSTKNKTFWKQRKIESFKSFFQINDALLSFLSKKPIAKELSCWQNG